MKKEKLSIYTIIISLVAIFCSIFSICFCIVQKGSIKTDEEIFNENINKVVEIRVASNDSWGYGTGCFISSDGLILTNKHMVYSEREGSYYETVQVRLPSELDFVDAIVVNMSENDDIAVIQIAKNNQQYFKLCNFNTVNNGEEIYTIGNPNGFGLSFVKGNVSCKLRKVTYEETSIEAIQTSIIVNEGNSGGPVFNKKGELVGIISFRLKDKFGDVIQGVSFAVPSYRIYQFTT